MRALSARPQADLEGTQKELDAALAYYEKLKPSCVSGCERHRADSGRGLLKAYGEDLVEAKRGARPDDEDMLPAARGSRKLWGL